MRWTPGSGNSGDVEDRTGSSGGFSRLPGGLGTQAGGGLGIAGIVVTIVILLLGGGSGGVPASDGGSGSVNIPTPGGFNDGISKATDRPASDALPASEDPDKDLRDFSTFVFGDVSDAWTKIFKDSGQTYRRAHLVLYSGGVNTGGCGSASSAVGPFYCPSDERVYIDLSFYEEMRDQLGASGDFAWAYVIAHELGHHVQKLTGTSDKVDALAKQNPDEANKLSVRLELQADCYAGVWGQTAFKRGELENGDLEEGLNAAAAVGDDRLEGGGGGTIDPDTFTHGSSAQRVKWFKTGFDSGDPTSCDTFTPDTV